MNPSRYQQAFDHLTHVGFNPCGHPEEQSLHFICDQPHGTVRYTLEFDENIPAQLIVAKFGISAPPDVRATVTEFANGYIGHENHAALFVDPQSGRILLRLTHTHPAGQFSTKVLDAAIAYLCRSTDILFPYLLRLITGQMHLASALEQLEADLSAFRTETPNSTPSS
jgi:hypothetical protein